MTKLSSRCQVGFTLIELLIVIAMIGILVALAIPAVQQVRESANRMECAANLKQVALAVHSFEENYGRIPFNQYDESGDIGTGPDSKAWSWLARLLPFIEQDDLYRQAGIPNTTLAQSAATDHGVAVFLCPSDPLSSMEPRLDAGNLAGLPVGQTNYKGVSGANWGDDLEGNAGANFPTDWRNPGTNGSFDGHSDGDGIFFRTDYRRPLRFDHIRDGTSNTFMIGEDLPALSKYCCWPYANNANGTCAIPPNVKSPGGGNYPAGNWQNNESFRSRHPGGLQFATADGSVHFINDTIDLAVYRALATINGGESVSLP
jgi:prepilin-type N-terminal cleavage/methylation domain-containing protein/prepilin-type processing-associated H-X9-DG protein